MMKSAKLPSHSVFRPNYCFQYLVLLCLFNISIMWLRTLKSEAFFACTCYNMHIPDTWSWFGALYHVLNKQAVNLHHAYRVCGHKLQAFALSHLSILLFGAIFSSNFVLFQFFYFFYLFIFQSSNVFQVKSETCGLERRQLLECDVCSVDCASGRLAFLESIVLPDGIHF